MTPAEPSRKKNRARSLPKARMEMQDSFFRRMGAAQQLIHLMDVVPGICFFIKDEHSRLIWVSRGILKRLGLSDSSELRGRQDHEFFPPQIAKMFVMDDRKVMRSGKPLLNRVELCYNEQRLLDWFVTTKLPIRDHSGHIIGIMGMMQSCSDRRRILFADSQITKALDYIRTHNRFPIRIGTLARASGASPRNLLRKFQREFRISVQEFILKTRIQAVSDALLRQERSIAELAADFGFCDQSALTKAFRQHIGLTPIQFRKKYLAEGQ